MASHFVGLPRGTPGTQDDDFLSGAATNASATIEVRVDDGAGYRPAEIKAQMRMLEKFLEQRTLWAPAGFVISG